MVVKKKVTKKKVTKKKSVGKRNTRLFRILKRFSVKKHKRIRGIYTNLLSKSKRFVRRKSFIVNRGNYQVCAAVRRIFKKRTRHVYFVISKFGYVTRDELNACKKLLVRIAKKRYILNFTHFFPRMKKPIGIRMGKGKGKKDYYRVCRVVPGQVFMVLRVSRFHLYYARSCIKTISSKMSIPLKLYVANI